MSAKLCPIFYFHLGHLNTNQCKYCNKLMLNLQVLSLWVAQDFLKESLCQLWHQVALCPWYCPANICLVEKSLNHLMEKAKKADEKITWERQAQSCTVVSHLQFSSAASPFCFNIFFKQETWKGYWWTFSPAGNLLNKITLGFGRWKVGERSLSMNKSFYDRQHNQPTHLFHRRPLFLTLNFLMNVDFQQEWEWQPKYWDLIPFTQFSIPTSWSSD